MRGTELHTGMEPQFPSPRHKRAGAQATLLTMHLARGVHATAGTRHEVLRLHPMCPPALPPPSPSSSSSSGWSSPRGAKYSCTQAGGAGGQMP